MRKSAAVVSWVVAAALGLGTGHYLLPDRSTVQLPWSQASSPGGDASTPAPPPEAEPTDYAKKPPTDNDLVSVKAFKRAGYEVKVYPQNGNTSPDTAATACTESRTVGARTLGDVTGYDPAVLGTWDGKSSDETADQTIAMAGSPAEAKTATERLLAAETTCQHETPGHWLRGAAHQEVLAPGVWAAWLGTYAGDLNTTGQAPADTEPCGGVIFARNGQRFSVLEVYFCTDERQLQTLAEAAAKRLG